MHDKSSMKVSSIKDRYLTFELDHEKYGVEILSVKEIIGMQKTIHIPKTPEFVKGVMNLRGVIIPVIDLRLKLGMVETERQMDTAIIIVTIRGINVGFIVDRVDEVASISSEELTEPPKFGSKVDTDFIKSMANTKKEVAMILNLESIFDADELSSMAHISKTNITEQGE